jgi:hypothetical protein
VTGSLSIGKRILNVIDSFVVSDVSMSLPASEMMGSRAYVPKGHLHHHCPAVSDLLCSFDSFNRLYE